MTRGHDVDVSRFSRFQSGQEAPLWWGVLLLVVIEATVVANFIASYFYVRLDSSHWPPAGLAPPDLLWPSVNVGLLLASCGTMWLAGRLINQNRQWPFVAAIFSSVVLASLVLVTRWQQFELFGFRWDSHPYGSVMWTLSGFHFLHVVSAVIGTAVVGVLGVMGFFNRKRQIAVVVDTMYWYFVAVVWIPLYIVLYWVPRWL